MTDRTDLRYSRERRRRQIERGVIRATEVGHGWRPILFSGPMVRAILEDRKTVTRRVVDLDPFDRCCETPQRIYIPHGPGSDTGDDWPAYLKVTYCETCHRGGNRLAPNYEPGDILWVRETWGVARYPGPSYAINYRSVPPVLLTPVPDERVDWAAPKADERWRPSIHMPRWAARLFLRVTEVRVERLQVISGVDAAAEGCGAGLADYELLHYGGYKKARQEFRRLWDSLNAKRGFGWDSNPWVWVYRFERTEAP